MSLKYYLSGQWRTTISTTDTPNEDEILTWDGTDWVIVPNVAVITVDHDSDENEVRPTYATTVYWKGSVPPSNGQNGDLWYDTTGDA